MVAILQDPFLRWPLIALLLAAVVCSFLAIYVILRRVVFFGAALAEISSLGVALGILVGERLHIHLSYMVYSLALVLLGIALFSTRPSRRRIPEEGIIGASWVSASALALLLIYFSQTGEMHVLDIVNGTPIGVPPGDVYLMAGLLIPIALIHLLFFKEFIFISFDAETAATQGYRTQLWDLLLYVTLGVSIAASIRTVGTLLTFSYLVIPGVVGLMTTPRLRPAFFVSVGTAAFATVAGYYLSVQHDWPTGATIIATLSLLALAAWVLSLLRKQG